MKINFTHLLGAMLALAGFFAPVNVQAQCANDNVFWWDAGSIGPGQSATIPGMWGGEYGTFNCVNGATYVISTCTSPYSWDTQLTLRNNANGNALAYNDDFCGLRSQITWTATYTGTVRVLLDLYNCQNYQSPMDVTITRNGGGGGGGGTCWDGTINGTGSVTASTCGAGNESALRSSPDRIYRIQIPSAGCYNFSLCGSSAFWDSYIYLTSACPGNTPGGGSQIATSDDGCGSFGGHGIISNVSLTAGTYFLTVEGFDPANCGAFTLNVTSGSAPVAGAITAPAAFGCGSTATFSVPFQSGVTYNWSTSNGTIVSGQGSNSVSIAWGSGTGTVSVVPSNACGTGAAVSTSVACTPPPANDNCANAIPFNGSSQSFSNLFASGSDITSCGFNDFNDVWYSWTAPSCGQVTFSTVCGVTWDSHLSLYTGCGGTELACNDDAFDYTCNYGFSSRITANVTAGQTYLLRVAGFNGASGTGTVFMSMSSPLSASATAGSILCNGGSTSVNVTANGGSGVYSGTGSFTASAGTFNYTVSDSYGCSVSNSINITQPSVLSASALASDYNGFGVSCNGGSNGSIIVSANGGVAPYSGVGSNNNLSAGTYSYTVADANGCTASTSASITEPSALSASTATSDFNGYGVSCNGGSNGEVTVSASGGVSPYTGVGTFSNLSAGSYSYTVADANGCPAMTGATITEPSALVAGASNVDYNGYGVSCFGGSNGEITVSATGGVAPYSGIGVNAGLSAGTYDYTVIDDNGCSSDVSLTLVEPTKVNISATNTAILCNGGNSDVTVTTWGGVNPYSVDDAGVYSVPAGSYTYDVVDANGCAASTTIDITQPALLTVDAGSDETVFYGYGPMECADLSASAAGGTGAYSYSWTSLASGGGIGSSITACPTSNETYTVTVADANGCIASDELSICVVDVHCEAGNSGIMKVEMCQVPPGNPANAHTICIDASAVPAHLAIGCQLGECGELAAACSAPAAKNIASEELAAALVAYPNPTESTTTISVTLTKAGNYSVEMFDMMGKLVKTVYAGSFEDYENLEFDVDMTNLNTGVYMISVSNGDQKIENIRVMKN